MIKRYLTWLVCPLAALLMLTVEAQSTPTITMTNFGYMKVYQLNAQDFSSYPTTTIHVNPLCTGANIGCTPLTFSADITLWSSAAKHTFTIVLKLNGVEVDSGHQSYGPVFGGGTVYVAFPQQSFRPGKWSIEWTFATSTQESDSADITLVAPILATLPWGTSVNESYEYCNRGGTLTAGYGSTGVCVYRAIPPTGFIWQNGYYINAVSTNTCAAGQFDGAHCYLGALPSGKHIFQAQGHYYYPYFPTGAHCQLPSSTDSAGNCLILQPLGTQVFEWMGGLYFSTKLICSNGGTFDGAHCLLGYPPPGASAFQYTSGWYWTPRYCLYGGKAASTPELSPTPQMPVKSKRPGGAKERRTKSI